MGGSGLLLRPPEDAELAGTQGDRTSKLFAMKCPAGFALRVGLFDTWDVHVRCHGTHSLQGV